MNSNTINKTIASIASITAALTAGVSFGTSFTPRQLIYPDTLDARIAEYNKTHSPEVTADTPMSVSNVVELSGMSINQTFVLEYLHKHMEDAPEFDAALSSLDGYLFSAERSVLPHCFSNYVAYCLETDLISERQAALIHKYGDPSIVCKPEKMSNADFFSYLDYQILGPSLRHIFNIDGNANNCSEKLARKYLRSQGRSFVGTEGAEAVRELVLSLRDAFKTPKLAGVQEWFNEYASDLNVTFDWRFPSDEEVATIKEKIMDGDVIVQEKDNNYWLLYFYLGEDAFKAFFAEYNGDTQE